MPRSGEEGNLQLGRTRVARGGGMSEKSGGEGQHHQARKGHMFFSELCFAGSCECEFILATMILFN